MSFLFAFAYSPRHPSFTPVTPSDRQELAITSTEVGLEIDPPTYFQRTSRRKILFYKATLVTVNLSVIFGLLLFYLHDQDRVVQGKALFGWIPKQSLLIPICLSVATIETVLIIGLLRQSLFLCKLNALKCAAHSLAALYLLTTVEHFVERTWPLCCDLLLYPLAGHISLLYVLELSRQKRNIQAWNEGYLQAHSEQRRRRQQQQEPQFDEVSL